jgi:hypothetical protein
MKNIRFINFSLFCLGLLLSKTCFSQTDQSLNGTWKGHSEYSIFVLNPTEIFLELEINNDMLISGIVHSYYTKGRYDHVKINGYINWKDSIFTIFDEKEISHNINTKAYDACFGTMTLKFTRFDQSYQLKGKWKDNSKKLIRCPTLNIYFDKQIWILNDVFEKESMLKRKTDIQDIIELSGDETDSIKLSLYDNGIIDNDTVSVFLNDSLLLDSKGLTQFPIESVISLDKKTKIHHLKLIAKNLGTIPPNTALLIITTRRNRYTITLSSDYLQNGSIEFFLKE